MTVALLRLQMHTSEQVAAGMVHAYPWLLSQLTLKVLAKDRDQPTMQALVADTSVDDLQHAANWEEVIAYLKRITLQNLRDYVLVLIPRASTNANPWHWLMTPLPRHSSQDMISITCKRRVDRGDGRAIVVLYNLAVHCIQLAIDCLSSICKPTTLLPSAATSQPT